MSRESMLIVLGALVVLSPFSGFPLAWLTWFYLFAGLLTAAIGATLRLRRIRRARKAAMSHEAPTPAIS